MNDQAIEQLKIKITNWRKDKPTPQSKMSEELRSQIWELSKSIPRRVLIRELNLSSSFFHGKSQSKQRPKTNSNMFIKAEPIPKQKIDLPIFKFSFKNGNEVTIYQ